MDARGATQLEYILLGSVIVLGTIGIVHTFREDVDSSTRDMGVALVGAATTPGVTPLAIEGGAPEVPEASPESAVSALEAGEEGPLAGGGGGAPGAGEGPSGSQASLEGASPDVSVSPVMFGADGSALVYYTTPEGTVASHPAAYDPGTNQWYVGYGAPAYLDPNQPLENPAPGYANLGSSLQGALTSPGESASAAVDGASRCFADPGACVVPASTSAPAATASLDVPEVVPSASGWFDRERIDGEGFFPRDPDAAPFTNVERALASVAVDLALGVWDLGVAVVQEGYLFGRYRLDSTLGVVSSAAKARAKAYEERLVGGVVRAPGALARALGDYGQNLYNNCYGEAQVHGCTRSVVNGAIEVVTIGKTAFEVGRTALRGVDNAAAAAADDGARLADDAGSASDDLAGAGVADEVGFAGGSDLVSEARDAILDEGSFSRVWRDGDEAVKEIKELVGHPDELYRLGDADRATLASHTAEFSNDVGDALRGRHGDVVPPMSVDGREIRMAFVDDGLTFEQLRSIDAGAADRALLGKDRLVAEANESLGLDYGVSGQLPDGHRVLVDPQMANFRFDENGNVVAWFDPVAVFPPERLRVRDSPGESAGAAAGLAP